MDKQPENIFNFFKQKFREESHLDKEWNNPPDFIFEDAINTVNAEKHRRRRRSAFLLLTLGAIVFLSLFQFYSSRKVHELEERVSELSQSEKTKETEKANTTISQQQTQFNKKSAQDLSQDKSILTNKLTEEREIRSSTLPFAQTKSTKNKLDHQTNSGSVLDSSKIPSESFSSQFSSEWITEKVTYSPVVDQPLTTRLQALSAKSINAFDIPNRTVSSPQVYFAVNDEGAIRSRKNSLVLQLENNFSTIHMKGDLPVGYTLTEYDKYYRGYGIRAQYSKSLFSRIRLVTSVSYSRIINKSVSEINMSYSKVFEKSINSQLSEYSNMMGIESPLGPLEERMVFMLDPRDASNDDIINSKTDIIQKLSLINSSIGVSLNAVSKNKISWDVSALAGLSYIASLEGSMKTSYVMEGKMMGGQEFGMSKEISAKRLFPTMNLTTSLSYKCSDLLDIQIGFGYQRSLSNLRSTPQDQASSHLKTWSTQLGISKQF